MKVIPHFSALHHEFSKELNILRASETRRYLVRSYIAPWNFDESWYLNYYPDLQAAIPLDAFADGWQHFTEVGYFEDRMPASPLFNSEWYMQRHEDAASAILDDIFASARDHLMALGRFEERLPYSPQIDVAWYAKRYLDHAVASTADTETCVEHFIRIGYLTGALPVPPR